MILSKEQYNKLPDEYKQYFERKVGGMGEYKVNDGRKTPIDNPFQRGETLRKNIHPTLLNHAN